VERIVVSFCKGFERLHLTSRQTVTEKFARIEAGHFIAMSARYRNPNTPESVIVINPYTTLPSFISSAGLCRHLWNDSEFVLRCSVTSTGALSTVWTIVDVDRHLLWWWWWWWCIDGSLLLSPDAKT